MSLRRWTFLLFTAIQMHENSWSSYLSKRITTLLRKSNYYKHHFFLQENQPWEFDNIHSLFNYILKISVIHRFHLKEEKTTEKKKKQCYLSNNTCYILNKSSIKTNKQPLWLTPQGGWEPHRYSLTPLFPLGWGRELKKKTKYNLCSDIILFNKRTGKG